MFAKKIKRICFSITKTDCEISNKILRLGVQMK